jgi:tRNA (guanine-N7-)-methyltransferase
MAEPDIPARRTIRSFVRRGGRITPAQGRALETLWGRFGADPGEGPLEARTLFGRAAPLVLEIGYGDGDSLVALAASRTQVDFLGLEVHSPGIGHCLLRAEAAGLTNLRLIRRDAVDVLASNVSPATLAEVLIWFPDPWPKKRHHKRRLLQRSFLDLLASRLARGALLRVATDYEPYAHEVADLLAAHADFVNAAPGGGFASRPADRPITKFEARGLRLGHRVFDLEFRRS